MRLLRFQFRKILCFVFFILWVYLLSAVEAKQMSKRGIMDNINNGLKYAGQMLGINTAADVASLVAKAFAPQAPTKKFDSSSLFQLPERNSEKDDDGSATKINPTDMIGGLLRMIGFDAGKLGALAINALLMIAQLIGKTLTKRQHPKTYLKSSEDKLNNSDSQSSEPAYDEPQDERSGREFSDDDRPIDWILNNPPEGLSELLEQITDRKLPDKLAEAVAKLEDHDGQGDCIKLLMCKSAPFIWGMQSSVSSRFNSETEDIAKEAENLSPISSLFRNLPDIDEYRRHGHMCDRRYSNFCNRNGA